MRDEQVSISARSGFASACQQVSKSARRQASPGGSQHFSFRMRKSKLKC